MLLLETKTKYGTISAIACIEGERYYFLIDRFGTVSMLPADVLESA